MTQSRLRETLMLWFFGLRKRTSERVDGQTLIGHTPNCEGQAEAFLHINGVTKHVLAETKSVLAAIFFIFRLIAPDTESTGSGVDKLKWRTSGRARARSSGL